MNLYELLEIAVDADAETIKRAITTQSVLWNRRAIAAVELEKRYDAERTIKRLMEAKAILLNADERSQYDSSLAATVTVSGVQQMPDGRMASKLQTGSGSTAESDNSRGRAAESRPQDAPSVTPQRAQAANKTPLPGLPGRHRPPGFTADWKAWVRRTSRLSNLWRWIGIVTATAVVAAVFTPEVHRRIGMLFYGLAEHQSLKGDAKSRRLLLGHAKTEFYLATLLNPKAAEPLFNLAVAHVDLGELTYARYELQRVIALTGPKKSVLREKAEYLLRRVEAEEQPPSTSRRQGSATPAKSVTTLCGSGRPGFSDGASNRARFQHPRGVAAGLNGAVLVADRDNHSIRHVSPFGAVTTLAGSLQPGYVDGSGPQARFNAPRAVIVATNGTTYVADTDNHCIRAITPEGHVSTLAGTPSPGFADGVGRAARFCSPFGLAMGQDGNLIVADMMNQRIRTVSPSGVVTTLAGNGVESFKDGPAQMASFSHPAAVAADANGNVYVVDSQNHRIRKIDPAGLVSTVAGSGRDSFADGPGPKAAFSGPLGIAVTPQGLLYVADTYNRRVRAIDQAGYVTTVAGSGVKGFRDGDGPSAHFSGPISLAAGPNGTLLVADWGNHRIRRVII